MAAKISYVDSYKHYGKCVKLENDEIEVLVTAEVGPRIIYFAAKGGENLFFNDDNDANVDRSPFLKELFGEEAEYHFYGGHRMWLAPQYQVHTESPDNEPCEVEIIGNAVTLTCPEAKVIGFISSMKVEIDDNKPEIKVTCSFTNTSDEPKKNAVWQITQCPNGGVGFYPFLPPFKMRKPFNEMTLADFSQPILPSTSLVMFLGSLADPRLKIDDDYITLSTSNEKQRPIKIGMPQKQGFAMFANKGYMLRFDFEHKPYGEYTDYSCSFESYTSPAFTEVEVLGELLEYKKGETISHTETISVMPLKAEIPDLNDRAAVKAFVELHK